MGAYTVDSSGTDCKSVVIDSGGATPSAPTINIYNKGVVSMSKELTNVPVYGRVIVSSNGKMIVKNNTDYYIILGHDNEGDQIVFEKEKAVAKFPSLMYLFASLADTKHVSEEDAKLLLNIIKRHW